MANPPNPDSSRPTVPGGNVERIFEPIKEEIDKGSDVDSNEMKTPAQQIAEKAQTTQGPAGASKNSPSPKTTSAWLSDEKTPWVSGDGDVA